MAEKEGWKTEFVHLDKPEFWLSKVGYLFHGRDIFSPVAAHLAAGIAIYQLGPTFDNPVRLELPRPQKTSTGWMGEIIHIDHFGNLASNIRTETLGNALMNKDSVEVRISGLEIKSLVNTFGERPVGELVALMGSTGNLIVSVVNGSAANRLIVKVGDAIEVILE